MILLKQTDVEWAWEGNTLKLTHIGTKLVVEGRLPFGKFNKSQLNERKRSLYEKLFEELESKVNGVG